MLNHSTPLGEIRQSTRDKYVGKRYGNMTILDVTRRDAKNTHHYFVRARCECGVEKETRLSGLQQGSTTSCGCVGKAHRLQANIGHTRTRQAFGENAKRTLYKNYIKYATERDLEFQLSLEEFFAITQQPCFYCNAAPKFTKAPKGAHGHITYNGVDRVDNSVGYLGSNCVAACRPCNSAKNAVTKEMVFKLFHRLFPHSEPALQPGA